MDGLDSDTVTDFRWPGATAALAGLAHVTPRSLVDLALEAVEGVAPVILDAWCAGVSVHAKSSAHDVVTQTDRDVERCLTQFLGENGPPATYLGEEGAGHDQNEPGAGLTWVIDPIDGTSNFAHGLPEFAVSIAAVIFGVPVAAVVHAPALGGTWRAWIRSEGTVLTEHRSRGVSTWMPLVTRGRGEQHFCALATDHPHAEELEATPEAASEHGELVRAFATVRRAVCTSVDVCRLASGVHDAVLGPAVKPWDIAAAALIAVGAGANWFSGGVRAGLAGPSSTPIPLTDGILDAPIFLVHAAHAKVPAAHRVFTSLIGRSGGLRSRS